MAGKEWMKPNPDVADRAPVDLRINEPHSARVYDYLLGGKDNFAADRAAADRALQANGNLREAARANRAFLRRVVRHLAKERGIHQFLDIGTGIPTSPNVHEIAQEIVPRARIVYVDNDPIVLAHARALLASSPEGRTAYLETDLRDVDRILGSPGLRQTLDLDQPVGLLLIAILHFIPDSDDPHGLVARLVDRLPAGSYLALSHLASDLNPEGWEVSVAIARSRGFPLNMRSRSEVERFFDGLDLVEPGVRALPDWRPEPDSIGESERSAYGGVARKR